MVWDYPYKIEYIYIFFSSPFTYRFPQREWSSRIKSCSCRVMFPRRTSGRR